MKNKKILSVIIASAIVILCAICVAEIHDDKKQVNTGNNVENVIENSNNELELNEVENNIIDDNAIEENPSTTEIPQINENDEQTVEVQETESEKFEEQGEIAYNGSDKTPSISVGEYAGLTYYSQIDSRWKNHLYTSTGNYSQTIGTSGCGPTSAAMVVSSIKGVITPETMADLYVQYGYRSANNGTYWSAFKWTADIFNIEYNQYYNLDSAISKLKENNYVICGCGQGLFTYGGHFIVIIGIDGDTLKIYDPYLYAGKFDTSTRRGKATVSGNTVYVTVDNFRKYANANGFFCFKNDRSVIKENPTPVIKNVENTQSNVASTNYKVKITAKSGLNVRAGASTSYKRIGGYARNTIVTIYAESNGWGKTNSGWISLQYTTRISTSTTKTSTYVEPKYTTGRYRVNASTLNVRTGPGTKYSLKRYYQLSYNARQQNKAKGNYYANGYKKGVVCTVTKIKGNWGLTPSGWICLSYCSKI